MKPPPGPAAAVAEGGSLRPFLLLWSGQVLSLLGTSIGRFALMLWAWEETGQATTLALLGFFDLGTTVVLSPIAGAIADRMGRKRAMLVSDLGAGLVTITLLALLLAGELEIWHLYAGALISGAFETLQFPAYSAAVTLLVPSKHYTRASGLISMAETASRTLGPPLAAKLLPSLGYAGLLGLDLATLSVAVVVLAVLHVPQPAVSAEGESSRGSLLAEAAWGFRYIFARRGLLALQLLLSAVNFFSVFSVILRAPMILARTGGDGQLLGNVMGAAGAGGIAGGLLLAFWGGPRRAFDGVALGSCLAMAGHLVLGLGQGPWIWGLGAFLFPLAITIANGSNQAIWQRKVPPDVQGRVFAVRRQIAQLIGLPAMLMAGPLADRWLEPAMLPDGALAAFLGPIFGTGPGAGMSVLVAVTGLLGLVVAVGAATSRELREVEARLPDHPRPPAG